jgi:putative transposase
MPQGRRHKPAEIVTLLERIETSVLSGTPLSVACHEVGIGEYTYYRWRGEYGELNAHQARRLKHLVDENSKLKRILSELGLLAGNNTNQAAINHFHLEAGSSDRR